jgi:hypothetical protein
MNSARHFAAATLASALAAACAPEPAHAPMAARTGGAAPSNVQMASQPGDQAGGDVSVGPFDSVELRGGGHVTLRYGATERVTLLAGSTQFTRFTIEDGDKLVIDACNDECPSHYDLQIEIVTPRLAAVAIEGGGKIETASGFPAMDMITAAVEGGGAIDLRAIDARNGTAAVTGGGKILIHADQHLTAAVNGGGSIRYSGTSDVTTAINGGGSVQPDGE